MAKGKPRSLFFRRAGDERGFTLAEMAVTITVLGVILGVGIFELTGTNKDAGLKSASMQVQRAISEAYSIAQNESTLVTLDFYKNGTAVIQNTYQVSRGATATSMQPPLGIKFLTRNVSGVDHYYVKLNDGSAQPTISGDVTIRFAPVGATTKMVDGAGTPVTSTAAVTLQYAGISTSKVINVNAEGRVTIS